MTSHSNASKALRRAGFILMARPSPPLSFILQTAQNSTIFAIRDSAIRNTSHPFWFLKTLLLYHTTTYNPFSFHDLLNMSQGTCLTTLLCHKNISLTKVDRARNSVEINNVLISNPNPWRATSRAWGSCTLLSLPRPRPSSKGFGFFYSLSCLSFQLLPCLPL
ncbi:unnamed protein product [Sphenostylis stenocarpa]|uniref:Uncharacterized protein n=1 Tax=Sphenostylis stenocarpa TaxID=92480 RepID=A0AA86V5C7_9FABA|nr:unnamed protein product [Sphenostylis stenocarpa]